MGFTKLELIMIPVLFTQSDSNYKRLGFDCYDEQRNALSFPGGKPEIYHPPCRAWSRMRTFAKPGPGERWLAVWAVLMVRRYGGVLEHPSGSYLFKKMALPLDGSTDQYGGFVISVNQSWFGHRAEKKTLLYVVGCDRSEVSAHQLSFDLVQRRVGAFSVRTKGKPWLKEINKWERSATPDNFALWLASIIQVINSKNPK